MPDDEHERSELEATKHVRLTRRSVLKATGAGVVGLPAVSGTAAASAHYDGPFSRTYDPETVDPSDLNAITPSGQSPISKGEGEEIEQTIPKNAPEARGNACAGGGKAQKSATAGDLAQNDFDGLCALDARGVVPSDA